MELRETYYEFDGDVLLHVSVWNTDGEVEIYKVELYEEKVA